MHWRIFAAFAMVASTGLAQPAPAGRWDGAVTFGKLRVPFRIDFSGKGKTFEGTLVNGDGKVTSKYGNYGGGIVRLTFANGLRMAGSLANAELKGAFEDEKSAVREFTAGAYCTCGLEGTAGPEIMGNWDLGALGKIAVTRKGEDTFAMWTRGEETVGPLNGRFDGLSFLLHYFDGARAVVLELEPKKEGGMEAVLSEPGAGEKRGRAARAN